MSRSQSYFPLLATVVDFFCHALEGFSILFLLDKFPGIGVSFRPVTVGWILNLSPIPN